MNGKNINFDGKKIKTSDFYKNKKVFETDDIDVNKIFLKQNDTAQRMRLNTLLDIMITMLLDHYV